MYLESRLIFTFIYLFINLEVPSDDHSENNLAKFGYIIDMKVSKQNKNKKNKKSFYILGYLLELIIQIWRFEK